MPAPPTPRRRDGHPAAPACPRRRRRPDSPNPLNTPPNPPPLFFASDRSPGSADGAIVEAKRARGPEPCTGRASRLQAPIVKLTGHADAVTGLAWSPCGEHLASCSADRQILLWRPFGIGEEEAAARKEGLRAAAAEAGAEPGGGGPPVDEDEDPTAPDCRAALRGHRSGVTDVCWSGCGGYVFSAGADGTTRAWDAATGASVRTMRHPGKTVVNAVTAAPRGDPLVATGADDGATRIWDSRASGRRPALELRPTDERAGRAPVLSAAFLGCGTLVAAGSLCGMIRIWDARRAEEWVSLTGHADAVTGLAVSPDGRTLLSNSQDATLRAWDVRPFAPARRGLRAYRGHAGSFEQALLRCAWSGDGAWVAGGSADATVHVWDAQTRAPKWRLPGHQGGVGAVAFHPTDPVIASGSADKTIFLGELTE